MRVLPKSGLGKVCDYLLRYWAPLTRHLEHGQTRLDNNLIENAIRPSAIGKKNWLFVGHPDAVGKPGRVRRGRVPSGCRSEAGGRRWGGTRLLTANGNA